MLRLIVTLAAAAGMLIPPAMSLAGMNPEAKLAMHLIASADSLGWEVLSPAACESIDADLSLGELFEAGGYGYILLLAYHVEAVSGVEFAISGWPTGRGAPVLNGPYWIEEDATTFGDHLADGGATGLGTCVEPDAAGLIPLAYLTFGPLDSTDVPITLEFLPSTYTEPDDSLPAVTDCTEEYVVDPLVLVTGCAIGGTYAGPMPECGGRLDEGEKEAGEGEDFEWPVVVETGILYLYGNRLAAPYVFAFIGGHLAVNGLRLYPKLVKQRAAPAEIPSHIQEWIDVDKEAAAVTRDLLRRGIPYDSCVFAAVEVYRASSVVDSVRIVRRNIAVWWSGETAPYWIVPPGPPPRRRPTREEVCMEIAEEMRTALRPSRVVFYGSGGTVVMSERQAAADLNLLWETRDPDAEGLLLLGGETGRDLLNPISLELLEQD